MAQINASMNDMSNAVLANPLPKNGIGLFLKTEKMDMLIEKISLKDIGRTNRVIQDIITKKISNNRNERIILCIDRTSKRECVSNKTEDMLYVFQLNEYDKIRKDYNDEHMSWMTKRQIFPEWRNDINDKKLKLYKGGGDDIGDNGFVFSFHIHSLNNIKCELFIKSQRLPFLPYHMIDLWPMYFNPKFNKINDKLKDNKYIYTKWKLPTDDITFLKWIKVIDPQFYKVLQKQHLNVTK
eukprot:388806_1